MVLSRHLVKRKKVGIWYFVRRVPLQYQSVDKRTIIQQSTGIRISDDPRGIQAGRVADAMDEALESFWQSSATEGSSKALAEYQAACQAAMKLGVSPPLQDKKERLLADLLDRVEMLERGKIGEDTNNVAALLDDAPLPALTFRQCAEQYIESHKAGWSNEKHAKQWPATLQQYAYKIIGNMPVAQLSGRSGTQKIKEVLGPICTRNLKQHHGCAAVLKRCSIGRKCMAIVTVTIRRAGKAISTRSIPRKRRSRRSGITRPSPTGRFQNSCASYARSAA